MSKRVLDIAIVEPSEIILEGLSAIIRQEALFRLSATYSSLEEYIQQVGTPDATLCDILILNTNSLRLSELADVKGIVRGAVAIVALAQSGSFPADALKGFDEVISIADSAENIREKLFRAANYNPDSEKDEGERGALSQREKEILAAVATGKTNKEIAEQFNLSVFTVITHRKNISKKTGINSISGLTVYAIINKLIDITSLQNS